MSTYQKMLSGLSVIILLIAISFSLYFGLKVIKHEPAFTDHSADEISDLHFVLIPQEMDNDYWQLVYEGAKEAETEFDFTLEYKGPNRTNIDEHIRFIETAIASQVDGIITQGLTEEAFTPVINKAAENGIPVITIDADAVHSDRIAYVGSDNYYAGYLAGQELIKNTQGEANVGIVSGSLEESHMQSRVNGFQDAVEQEEGIHIVDVNESYITRIQAADTASQMLQQYPEIDTFFGTSSLDGIGIADVVEQEGLAGEIFIIAFDIIPETLDLIEQGVIQATIAQDPYDMGFQSVKRLNEVINDEEIETTYNTNLHVIDTSNISSWIENEAQLRMIQP